MSGTYVRTKEFKDQLAATVKAQYDAGRVVGMQGKSHTDESRTKMTAKLKAGYENGRVHNMQGKQHSENTKAKMKANQPTSRQMQCGCGIVGSTISLKRNHADCVFWYLAKRI